MRKTLDEVMQTLQSLGTESRRKTNTKNGAGENQFGVMMGQLRSIGKEIGIDHELSMQLWDSGNADAMLLSCMTMDPNRLTLDKAESMVAPLTYSMVLDAFVFGPLSEAVFAQELMFKWIKALEASFGRAGWNLLIGQIMAKKTLPFTIDDILSIIDNELTAAIKPKQEAMNRCLCEIGIRMREYTHRCIDIGEKYGRLDNRPIPKGCTSSYAPEWIAAGIRLREARKRQVAAH